VVQALEKWLEEDPEVLWRAAKGWWWFPIQGKTYRKAVFTGNIPRTQISS